MENMEPPMCANGCGFYGSSATFNFCSKCFKRCLEDRIVALQITGYSSPISNPILGLPAVAETVVIKPPRCGCCKKKVGLLGFSCRCGTVFCGSHRHPEDHSCNFDYKAAGIDTLQKANPRIQADRLRDRI